MIIKHDPGQERALNPNLNRFSPSIHPNYLRLLCAHIAAKGLSVEVLCEQASLPWSSLIQRQHFVSLEQFQRMVESAQQALDCPWLALDMLAVAQVSAHGPLGYGAMAARDVEQALALVEVMMPTRLLLYDFKLDCDSDSIHLCMTEQVELADLQSFIQVMLVSALIDLLERMTGRALEGLGVSFSFDEPDWFNKIEASFKGVNCVYGAAQFVVTVPRSILEMPSLVADPFTYKNAYRECQQSLGQGAYAGALAQGVLNDLASAGAPFPSLVELARRYNMSSRTFIRKLKCESQSYQRLLDEVRKDIASWHLTNSALSVEQIAEHAGFVDSSNFARVFRRWYACTPSEYRARKL